MVPKVAGHLPVLVSPNKELSLLLLGLAGTWQEQHAGWLWGAGASSVVPGWWQPSREALPGEGSAGTLERAMWCRPPPIIRGCGAGSWTWTWEIREVQKGSRTVSGCMRVLGDWSSTYLPLGKELVHILTAILWYQRTGSFQYREIRNVPYSLSWGLAFIHSARLRQWENRTIYRDLVFPL